MIFLKEGASMQEKSHRGLGAVHPDDERDDRPMFVPSIDTVEVFRKLILDELRSGRLTPSRRRRIVQYAAHLGLSAVQAGRLVEVCREELLHGQDAIGRYHALRLVEPPPSRMPVPLKIALVVAAAILFDVILFVWLW